MATRLDRLFLLLDSGSTPVIRKSAAEQLGEVQKLHPHELNNLLSKVHVYLQSANWDTRIAAGQAVEAICRNVPKWQPVSTVKKEEARSDISVEGRLQLSQFDIQKVLVNGASLLGSEGAEYEEEDVGMDEREKLARQKQLLNKRLGLDVAGGMGIEADDLFKEEDLVTSLNVKEETGGQSAVQDILKLQLNKIRENLSARERNRAKRKAKLLTKQTSKEDASKNGDSSDGEPATKLRKTASVIVKQPDQDKILLDNIPDNTLNMEEIEEWPFDIFCEVLMNDLFHPSWERRHGASTGLREVVKMHGSGAGKYIDQTEEEMKGENQSWLEDLAVRLVCVVALDRFGDFVSDEVVAPVRETCAQTLGVALRHMSAAGVEGVVQVLMQLLVQRQWEVRHGGLLGLKYLLAVRQDLTSRLLPMVLPVVYSGLQDLDDDVRAVAAAALLPVTDTLVTQLEHHIPQIVECLWYTLLDLDDLTASTNCIMNLLSTLLAHPKVSAQITSPQSLTQLVPRLWPFFRHNIWSVRKAALQTLYTLLTPQSDQGQTVTWLLPILQDALRHVYQRSLLENKPELLEVISMVWEALLSASPAAALYDATGPWLGIWLCLLMQPHNFPFDPAYLIEAKHTPKTLTPSRARYSAVVEQYTELGGNQPQHKDYIGGSASLSYTPPLRDMAVIRARMLAARLLGVLCARLIPSAGCQEDKPVIPVVEGLESPQEALSRLLGFHLSTKSAMQRMVIAMVMCQWSRSQSKSCECPEPVTIKLHECLVEAIYFDEIALAFTRLQNECKDFMAGLREQGINLDSQIAPGTVLTLEQAEALCSSIYDSVKVRLKARQQALFEGRRQSLITTVQQTGQEQQLLNIRVQSSLAGAVISLRRLPDKMNPVVRPLMEAIKKEQNAQLQEEAAFSLSQLLELCSAKMPSPNAKVIKNLSVMLCSDPNFTPTVRRESQPPSTDCAQEPLCDTYSGILTLNSQQVKPVTGRGRKTTLPKKAIGVHIDISMVTSAESESHRQILVARRGATMALTTIARDCGPELPEKMPDLWQAMLGKLDDDAIKASSPDDIHSTDFSSLKDNTKASTELTHCLQVLEVTCSAVDQSLLKQIEERLLTLGRCLQHPFTVVRHMTARCLGMLSKIMTSEVLNSVLCNALPLLGATDSVTKRQGSVEVLANIIEQLGSDIIPYIVLLVVPILGAMSDQNEAVRLMATACFATLIRLMPLEAGIPDPSSMAASLVEKKGRERKFLEQLLDGSKIENYAVPIPIKAELRKYQQDGVNWLAFLNTYKLHGILCDDMGLGKTIQSLCLLAGDHYYRDQQYKETGHADSAPLPSIVVCPPTLTGHWVYEVEKFVDPKHLFPLHYTGPPQERNRLQKKVKKHNLIVASYDVVRNDIDFFRKIKFNYCILDEGHIIKNSKTKLSRAVKQLTCNHRLILSGTPIQNNVLELWSLFDFLMPGFLGTERQFQARYGKPILQSRDAKSSSKEQEAGALAMESLHRQVLPFLLRRLKEDVLKDLPPKIIQDYYCDLSPLQVQLYEDFAKSRAKRSVEDSLHEVDVKEKKQGGANSHIFQALQYLRKVCNHPTLVLTPQHPEYGRVTADLKRQGSKLRDLQHAPKLTALKQLLLDCGIGLTGPEALDVPVVNQHRVLLFCQLKSMLDIVEHDLLKGQMSTVTYLRLDGSVPPGNRHIIVNRFNNDPSIDILLLTTHVGGLGLNLTGADTVIFVEHDWNPMKDLQAMDRAHRIGQKKVVNVYRLITRGTLEEKIMGLQKFKINIANTIISQENASLASMGTDQLLDLFSLEESSKQMPETSNDGQSDAKKGMNSVLEDMNELWDEKQYENEYDLSNFMKTLKN